MTGGPPVFRDHYYHHAAKLAPSSKRNCKIPFRSSRFGMVVLGRSSYGVFYIVQDHPRDVMLIPQLRENLTPTASGSAIRINAKRTV